MGQGTHESGRVPAERERGAEQREGARAMQDVLADADQRDDEADDRDYERGRRCPTSSDGDHDFLLSEQTDTRRGDVAQIHECQRCGFTYGDHRPADRRATAPPLMASRPPLPASTDSPQPPAAVRGREA